MVRAIVVRHRGCGGRLATGRRINGRRRSRFAGPRRGHGRRRSGQRAHSGGSEWRFLSRRQGFDVAARRILSVTYLIGGHDELAVDPDVESTIILTWSIEPDILSDRRPVTSSKLPGSSTDTQSPVATTNGFGWSGTQGWGLLVFWYVLDRQLLLITWGLTKYNSPSPSLRHIIRVLKQLIVSTVLEAATYSTAEFPPEHPLCPPYIPGSFPPLTKSKSEGK